MELLSVNKISKSFDHKSVLNEISFEVERKSFVSIFGPNASGKTTLLNIIAGLVKPDSGQIEWTSQNLQSNISYVFQNYRETLFPWKNVWQNITLPLKLLGVSPSERKERAIVILQRFSIEVDINKYPYELSGGQQQLVAIMRAIITKPDLLLLDEPFSALDFQRRLLLQQTILEIWKELEITIVFVSHDLDEAILLADNIIVLKEKPSKVIYKENIDIIRPRQPSLIITDEFTNYRNKILAYFLKSN